MTHYTFIYRFLQIFVIHMNRLPMKMIVYDGILIDVLGISIAHSFARVVMVYVVVEPIT